MGTDKQLIAANRFSFLAAGFGIAAWAPMIPFIKERYALDEHNLGLLLLCVGIGSMISMPTSGYLVSRLGCRKPVLIAGLVLGFLLLAITLVDNLILTGLLLILFGMSAVTLDVVSNINGALVEAYIKRDVMSGLHGLYSVGGFLGSLTVTTLLSLHLGIVAAAVYTLICMCICVLWGCRHLFDTVHAHENEEQTPQNDAQSTQITDDATVKFSSAKPNAHQSNLKYYTHPVVLTIGIMCFILFMIEGSILDWSGVYLTQERDFPLEYAGYGYAAFAIMMTCFRLLGDKIVSRFGRRRVLLLGTITIACGYLIAVYIPHFTVALCGFALIGIGASNVVPQLVSVTGRIKDVPVHISVTIVNAIGFSGMLCGPAIIGFLAHAITLPYTFLCQAASVLVVTFMITQVLKKPAQVSTQSTMQPNAITTNTTAQDVPNYQQSTESATNQDNQAPQQASEVASTQEVQTPQASAEVKPAQETQTNQH